MGDYKCYQIEMLIVQGNTETQIALSQLYDHGAIPLLGGKNNKKTANVQQIFITLTLSFVMFTVQILMVHYWQSALDSL